MSSIYKPLLLAVATFALSGCSAFQVAKTSSPNPTKRSQGVVVQGADIPGLVVGFDTAGFQMAEDSTTQRTVAPEAIVWNSTKKAYRHIKIHVTVTWDVPPDKVEADFDDWEVSPFGGLVTDVLPPGWWCKTGPLRIPITDDQWRLDYKVDLKLVSAEEFDPKAMPDDPLCWQLTALCGKADDTLALLKARPELSDEKTASGFNIMDLAIASGDVKKVKGLEAAGVPMNSVSKKGMTPLHLAAFANKEMVEYVLTKRIKPEISSAGYFPLAYAIYSGNQPTFEAMVAGGADTEMTDAFGDDALKTAIESNQVHLLNLIVKRGVNVKAFNNFGFGPLGQVLEKRPELLELVFKVDKNINEVSPINGMTPLHVAVKNDHREAVEWLLQHGADKSIRDKSGKLPRDYIQYIANDMDQMRMEQTLSRH